MSTSQLIANRFEISDPEKDLLGRGGMGDVYRATDTQTGEPVAVKALSPGVVARDPDIVERFVREGQALRQLNHPNIVSMVAAVEEEGQHYLVMEYVGGGSLRDLLEAQRPDRSARPVRSLPSTRALEIALDLADALTRAHRLGIIHRDLKPANVLLAEDGTPRLTDFGIAHVADSPRLTETGILVGTVDYLSPEACNGEPLDARADIWAFGVLLYEMLSGERPFTGETLTAKLTAILRQPVPDLAQLAPSTPDTLVDLVYRMLEKDRQQRIPSVRLVGTELEAILKGWEVPTPARPAPVESRFAGESRFSTPTPPAQPPSFLEEEEPVERPVFVARERELAQLDGYLNTALAGQGRVVFITGDAGQGKTALVQGFARRAQAAHPDLVVASGNCNAHTGIGDPYLPFREILGLLTGDVEGRWAARAISQEQARRLWHTFPLAVQALVETGPDLIDLFVPGAALVKRTVAFAPGGADWLTRLEELAQRKRAAPGDPNLQQSALFEQYTRVVGALASQRPLLLVLDDLQWADGGSTSLLFHLGRRIEGSRVLIVGTYRPAEVALGRPSTSSGQRERHPLEPVVNEFKRHFGDIEVDLGQAEDRQFVEAFLDTEPNRLGETFRRTLYRQTRGHPLSTVELLRDMQERGGLVQDGEGRWVEGPALDWESLPARVEAVIAERMGRLAEPAREALRVASVEGEAFTAEVVARVLAADEREMVRWLSKLDREHHLVSAQGIQRVDSQRLSVYRFRHILFQRYLYNSLDRVERVYLHETVGTALEALYGEGAEEIAAVAVQLARHFQEGGIPEKAVAYLLQAGNRAARLSANEEAIAHFRKGLELLQALPDTPERARQEIELRIYLAIVLANLRGYADTEVGQAYRQAYGLCERSGETLRIGTVASGLFLFHWTRAEYGPALEMAERLLSIASKRKSRLLRLVSDNDLNFVFLLMGELDKSLKHAEQAIASYSPHLHRLMVQEGGMNVGLASRCWAALDRDFDERTGEVFQDESVPVPHWLGRHILVSDVSHAPQPRPSSAPSAGQPASARGDRAPLRLPTLPGATFANRLATQMEGMAAGMVSSVERFASGVTRQTNPPPVRQPLELGWDAPKGGSGGGWSGGGGGGGCACACACAGCACACAGGGR
ncbi:MAG: hypothetical protein E3J21_05315 [Anaerolineales bacterium]|nr:MAG: hypothetical protein E3J21_05315 [Anaerolineales bacterium]